MLSGCSGLFLPAPTAIPTPSPLPTLTPTPIIPRVWISPAVPAGIKTNLKIDGQFEFTQSENDADILLEPSGGRAAASQWVYTLVAPFNSVVDGITLEELKLAWQKQAGDAFSAKPILLSADTLAAFESIWGKAADNGVRVLNSEEITDALWQEASWGLMPFEELNPRLKVLNVDGVSPFMTGFNPAEYPVKGGILGKEQNWRGGGDSNTWNPD